MSNDKSIVAPSRKNIVAMKPSGAIEISSGDFSLIQRKSWNLLLANAYPDITRKEKYSIAIAEICKYLGYNDYASLRICLEKLVTTPIKFNYLKSRDKSEWWEITALLAQATIKNGILYYAYSPLLREKISTHEYYAKINLLIQKNIDSKYTLILYEMAKNHYIESKGIGYTPFISIDDLREILGCADNKLYDNFKYFNARVIKKAVKEVNEKCEIQISVIYHRTRRVVDSVQFKVSAKEDRSGILRAIADPRQEELRIEGNELYNRLVNEYEITRKQAAEIVKNYDPDYIVEKLAYVARLKVNGQIKKSLGAATYDAITQNYSVPVVEVLPPRKDALPQVYCGMKVRYRGKTYTVDENLVIYLDKKTVLTEGDIRQGLSSKTISVVEE